jgi:flagellar biosynthesis/type III secretory pathway chaperone
MTHRLDELAGILSTELELTRKLLDLAKDARAAVVSADPELLAEIVAEQEEWAARLEVKEARRIELVLDLGNELGLGDEPKLSAIVERAPRESGLRLRSVGRQLKDAAGQLRETGRRNSLLLKEASANVDSFFELLSRACQQGGSYRPDGNRQSPRRAAVLDQQV